MKRIFALLASSWLVGTALAGAAPVFQIRPVVDAPTMDSETLTITSQLPNNQTRSIELNVQFNILIDETALKSAREVTHEIKLATDQKLRIPEIEVRFTSAGRAQLAAVTSQNIGKKLAILINGRVYCAPRIGSPITGGKVEITGSFTEAEARALATDINAACAK